MHRKGIHVFRSFRAMDHGLFRFCYHGNVTYRLFLFSFLLICSMENEGAYYRPLTFGPCFQAISIILSDKVKHLEISRYVIGGQIKYHFCC